MFFRGIFGIITVLKNSYLFIPRYVSKPLTKLRSVQRYVSYLDSSAIKQHTLAICRAPMVDLLTSRSLRATCGTGSLVQHVK